MELTWYGLSCFRITERGFATVVTDPYKGSKVGLPDLKLKADIVTVSHDADGHNYERGVTGQTHTLSGPGEYEIGNVFIAGVASNRKATGTRNTLFVYNFNGFIVAHMGDIATVPTQAQIEDLGDVHVLLLPIGGGNSLNAAQATELVSMIEPNLVVPMHYQIPDQKLALDGADRFLQEMGVTEPKEEKSLKISASNLPEDTQVVLLTPKL
jgi:L-ascorbate metabolism protein UlaG (beta-lactamase superfamily)